MALFKPFMGSRASLDTLEKHAGYAYFCTDDGSFHIDYVDSDGNLQRKQISTKEAEKLIGYDIATILNSSESEIPTSKAVLDAIDAVKIDAANKAVVVLAEAQADASNKVVVALAQAQAYADAVAQKAQVQIITWEADD